LYEPQAFCDLKAQMGIVFNVSKLLGTQHHYDDDRQAKH